MSEPQKRRGRPRVPEEERKRHTLTFRMRSDLRDAVEELAEANGRTLSEQVEYYVDTAVFSEASLIYQYSTDVMSQTIRRCISKRISDRGSKEDVRLAVDFPSGHREMLTIQGKTCLNRPLTRGSLAWSCDPGGKEGAVSMARAMLVATRNGAVDALVATLGSEAVEAALIEERKVVLAEGIASINQTSQLVSGNLDPNSLIQSMIEEFRNIRYDLDNPVKARPHSQNYSAKEGDHSFAALVSMIDNLRMLSPDLSALWSSSWPRAFADLPADTRSALIGAFKDEASSVYETLMRPPSRTRAGEPPIRPSPQDIACGIQLGALRKMQHALLPHRDEDDGEDFWGDEDGPARERA